VHGGGGVGAPLHHCCYSLSPTKKYLGEHHGQAGLPQHVLCTHTGTRSLCLSLSLSLHARTKRMQGTIMWHQLCLRRPLGGNRAPADARQSRGQCPTACDRLMSDRLMSEAAPPHQTCCRLRQSCDLDVCVPGRRDARFPIPQDTLSSPSYPASTQEEVQGKSAAPRNTQSAIQRKR